MRRESQESCFVAPHHPHTLSIGDVRHHHQIIGVTAHHYQHHSIFCSLTISNERQASEVEKPFPLLSPIFHLTIMIVIIMIIIMTIINEDYFDPDED